MCRGWPFAALMLLVVAMPAHADMDMPEARYPQLPAHAATPEGFVPAGWIAEQVERRDFNRDGHEDVLLLLRQRDPANVLRNEGLGTSELDTNPRLLVAALADAERGGYALSFSDGSLIPRHDSPTVSDPIEEGGLSATERGFALRVGFFASAGTYTMSNTTYTFRYQDDCFRLIGYDYRETHRATLDTREVSVNYLTQRVKDTNGNAETGASHVTWRRLPPGPPLCIQSAQDWDGLRPEILSDNSR